MILLSALLVATLVAAAPPADKPAAPEHPADADVTFTVPDGWKRVDRDRVIVLMPEGATPLECAVVISPGEKLDDDDFPKWFAAKWDALRKGGKVVQGGARSGKEGPDGSSVLVQAGLLESPGAPGERKTTTGLMLYAVRVGDAAHYAVFKTDGAAKFNEYKKTVNQFLASMKFTETKVVETPPDAKKPKRPPAVRRRPGAAGSGN